MSESPEKPTRRSSLTYQVGDLAALDAEVERQKSGKEPSALPRRSNAN